MGGQRKALIVASDEYEHEGLRRLLSPAADADALARVLGDPRIGDFDVHVVHNEPAHIIQLQVEELFSDRRPDDLLLLHLSCHGLKSESGELFFAARNTRPDRLGSTAISADFVQRCIRTSRSRSIVVLLDCCYGGAFGEGVTVRATGDVNVLDSFPGGRLGGGRSRAVITASSSMEYAFEGDHLADEGSSRPSVFTTALVEGLTTGDADRDEDGWIALNELYEYVFDRVREQNPHQTPSRDIEMQGELYLARSRRRRIHPLPIPADLRAATTDPNMFTRLGALSELRSRLASDNLPVAAGAYDAVMEMAGTDIRNVADAATSVLGEAAIRVSEPALHFGQVEKDSSLAHREVRLLGLPLARACTIEASHNWIRVDETAEGLAVTVDTSTAGTRSGTITFTGPTGQAMIVVDVEVVGDTEQRQRPNSNTTDTEGPILPLRSAPAANKAADLTPPPTDLGRPVPRHPRGDTSLRIAGELAILGAALLVAGLLPDYRGSDSLWEKQFYEVGIGWYVWYVLTMAALALGAGVAIVVPHTRRVIGPGLLLGTVAASTLGLVFLVSDTGFGSDTRYSGFWLELAAHLVLVLAACLTGLALVSDPDIRLTRFPQGILVWWVVILGGAGSLALVFHTLLLYRETSGDEYRALSVSSIAAAVMALVVPACAAVAVPRRFGVFLLAGWIAGGATAYFLYSFRLVERMSVGTNPILVFGLTLCGLVVVAIYLDRAIAPSHDDTPSTRPGQDHQIKIMKDRG